MNKKKRSAASRQGTYTVGVTALVIAIVVVVNLVVAQLPSSMLEIDMTDGRLYSVSDTSKEFLSTLDKDVTITVLAEKTGIDERLTKFLDSYASLSSHIKLEYIDPVLYPSALETYGADENYVVISCEETGKDTTLPLYGMITIDEMAYYYYNQIVETAFDAEGQVTSAVDLVANEAKHALYTLTGHGESELPGTITNAIAKQNLTLNSLSLMIEGAIPEDCDLIISYMPTMDFSDEERALLEEYIAGGGNVMLLCDNTELANVNALMAGYGLQFVDGYIGDPQRYYQQSLFNIFPMLATGHNIIASLPADSVVLVANSRGLESLEDRRDDLTVQYFMYTSDNAIAFKDDQSTSEGRYLLAATSTESEENGGGRLTVFACPTMIDEYFLTNFTNLVNLDVFMNAVTDNFDDVSSIAIPAKSLEITYNTIPSASMWSLIFIAVIPVCCLVGGLCYWLKRRKL